MLHIHPSICVDRQTDKQTHTHTDNAVMMMQQTDLIKGRKSHNVSLARFPLSPTHPYSARQHSSQTSKLYFTRSFSPMLWGGPLLYSTNNDISAVSFSFSRFSPHLSAPVCVCVCECVDRNKQIQTMDKRPCPPGGPDKTNHMSSVKKKHIRAPSSRF